MTACSAKTCLAILKLRGLYAGMKIWYENLPKILQSFQTEIQNWRSKSRYQVARWLLFNNGNEIAKFACSYHITISKEFLLTSENGDICFEAEDFDPLLINRFIDKVFHKINFASLSND